MRAIFITCGLFVLQSGAALAQQATQSYYHGPHMWGGGYGWFMGPITIIVVIAAAVAVVMLLARWMGNPAQISERMQRTPLDILKERFARGEIDKEEFEDRRKILG